MSTAMAGDHRVSPYVPPHWPLSLVADLGGIALLGISALVSPIRDRGKTISIHRAAFANAGWMLAMGIPLVGLVHLSIGSFLAMQAYFGATFTEGAGIVVGLGLLRNIAPLLTGFIMAGLICTKVTSDLNGGSRPGLDDTRSVPDRDVERGLRLDNRAVPSAGRVALARVLGAALAGPTLAVWGATVGILMGLVVSKSMLGQSPEIFLGKIAEMLMPVDVFGLLLKGIAFVGSTALIATYEGLRPESRGGPDAYRAVLRSIMMILFLNFTWFNLVYLAGDPFGPNVAASAG
jgi:phospholipid/cholesterol/gamma-HCH transport system permease protein